MVLGYYPPRLRPTEFAPCSLISGLSIWSTHCALTLSEPVQSTACAILRGSLIQYASLKLMRYPPRSLPIQFVLRALILERDSFNLRIALLSWVCPFNTHFRLSRSLLCFSLPSTTLGIVVHLRSPQTTVCLLCAKTFSLLA